MVSRKQVLYSENRILFSHKPRNVFQGQKVRICMNTIQNSVSGIPNGREYLLLLEN